MTSHTTSQESGWYSVKETCRILDISRRTLYDRIESKKIDTKKNCKSYGKLNEKNEEDVKIN